LIVVDSCGWLEYLGNTPRSRLFEDAIEGRVKILVPSICIYEVFRKLMPSMGKVPALTCIASIARNTVVALDATIAVEAASFAAELHLSMADAIIYATTRTRGAELWTQDAHFKDLEGVKYFPKDE